MVILAKPTAAANAVNVIDFIYDIICRFGCSLKISCDNGKHFQNKKFKAFCHEIGIKLVFSTFYSSQPHGSCEKMNHTLCKTLAYYINEEKTNWSKLIRFVTFTYNVTPISNFHKLSPYFLVYGKNPNLPIDNQLEMNLKSPKERIEEIKDLAKIRKMVPKLIYQNQKINKKQYDKTCKEITSK